MIKYFFLILIFLISTVNADFKGKVIRVIDGDTIEVLNNKTPVRVRLYGIDAPESKQAYGNKATSFLKALIASKEVTIKDKGLDVYNRTLGVVLLDNANINKVMIKNGYAWAYDYKGKYSDHSYKELQDESQKSKLGLWQEASPVKPYDFRNLNKH